MTKFDELHLTGQDKWYLRLYVAGQTPKSVMAFANLKKLCEEYMHGQYEIEIIDLIQHPELAQQDKILAIPTLVRRLPPPIRQIIGDLSDKEKVLIGLDITPAKGHQKTNHDPR
ncbi:MAG: hypothetical protein RLZZ597_1118 [Cyanobacteriota bacterium]|jgi:circadian clock protein KaiB